MHGRNKIRRKHNDSVSTVKQNTIIQTRDKFDFETSAYPLFYFHKKKPAEINDSAIGNSMYASRLTTYPIEQDSENSSHEGRETKKLPQLKRKTVAAAE